MYSSAVSWTSALGGVDDQRHSPAALPQGKTRQEAAWAPGTVWTGAEKITPTGIWSPDRPASSESLYRLCTEENHDKHQSGQPGRNSIRGASEYKTRVFPLREGVEPRTFNSCLNKDFKLKTGNCVPKILGLSISNFKHTQSGTEHLRIHTKNQIRHFPSNCVCSQGHTTRVNLLKLHSILH